MVFSERVTSITQDKFVPSVVDAILNSNVLTQRTMGRAPKVWSGETLRRPVQIAKSTTGGSFSGADKFDVSAVQTRIKMSFEPKGFYQSATIIGIEKAVNKTEAQVLSLVKATLEEAENSALDSIGDLNFGGGAGDDFEGLANTVDDGTSYVTYGGQSRTTYSALKGTVTASGGSLTLTKMANLWTAISAAGSGKQKPTIGVSDETVWNLYESLLAPAVINNYQSFGLPMVNSNTAPGMAVQNPDGLKGTQGFVAITYRGMPIVADEKATAQTLFFLNEHYLDWYSLKDSELQGVASGGSVTDGVYSEGKGSTPFQWTGFKVPTDQYVAVGQLICMGNLVSFNPRRHGKLTGVTTA